MDNVNLSEFRIWGDNYGEVIVQHSKCNKILSYPDIKSFIEVDTVEKLMTLIKEHTCGGS